MFEEWKLKRELSLLHVSEDIIWRPFNQLSGGEQTKVLLALCFIDERFSLLDEPTNHLDQASRKQIAEYLKQKKGYIITSHDRDFIDQVSDHVLAIDQRQIWLSHGNYSTYRHERDLQDQAASNEQQKLQREIKHLAADKEHKQQWAGQAEKGKRRSQPGEKIDKGFVSHKASKVMKRAISAQKRMAEKLADKSALIKPVALPADLTMHYQASHRKLLLSSENPKFELNQGERLAIVGPNGCGKSQLLKRIALGEGVASGVKVSYLPQIITPEAVSLEEFIAKHKLDRSQYLNLLRKLGVERAVFTERLDQLSSGQLRKVWLAKSLLEPAELYLWDEPSNYLDIENQDQLIKLIKNVQPSLLLVEHDQYILDSLAIPRFNLAAANAAD